VRAFRNDKGDMEGVKYTQLSAVLVNAVNERQQEIRGVQHTLADQQRQIEALRRRRGGSRRPNLSREAG
jgi:hypothetical protein